MMRKAPARISLGETAALVERALAESFPDVRFAVDARTPTRRSRIGPRCSWIAVTWTEGPHVSEVRNVTAPFEGTRFFPAQGRRRRQTHRVVDDKEPQRFVRAGDDRPLAPASLSETANRKRSCIDVVAAVASSVAAAAMQKNYRGPVLGGAMTMASSLHRSATTTKPRQGELRV
jgi:hypothetical protein